MTLEELKATDWDSYSPGDFIDRNDWSSLLPNLKEAASIIVEELRIIESRADNIPTKIKERVAFFSSTLLKLLEDLKQPKLNQDRSEVYTRQKEQHFNILRDNISQMLTSKDQFTDFYTTYAVVKSVEHDFDALTLVKAKYSRELDNQTNKIAEKIAEIETQYSVLKKNTDNLLIELSKKAGEEVTSSYAHVFKTQSSEYSTAAKIWLTIAVVSSTAFIAFLVFMSIYKWMPTEEVLSNGVTIKYLLSNILARVLIYAILIYFIGFSFKQYSINKHLSTINKHRQNGLDSYKLFAGSLKGDDMESRNTLLLQLAKAIYEQSTTGYIGDKDSGNISSSIIEITKMIRGNGDGK